MQQSFGCLNLLLLLLLCTIWFQIAAGSYLQLPRINFNGRFQANIVTSNKEQENFYTWAMVDSVVTSAIYTLSDGTPVIIPPGHEDRDTVVGLSLVNNPSTSLAKVDVDIDDQLVSTTIYGMQIGINWDPLKPNKPNSFFGVFIPAIVASDDWERQAKSESEYQQTLGTRSVSKIANVTWSNKITSPTLLKLKEEAEKTKDKSLSIRFTLFNYKNSEDDLFLHGNIIGSIGVSQDDEALQFPENRVMPFVENSPLPIKDKDCESIGDWMHGAYFDVDLDKSRMQIDMSNSFALGVQGNICQLYPLYVGILTSSTITVQKEVEIIEEIPYLMTDWHYNFAGIMDISLTSHYKELISEHNKVVIVTKQTKLKDGDPDVYPLCSAAAAQVSDTLDCVYVILEEDPRLIRQDIAFERIPSFCDKTFVFSDNEQYSVISGNDANYVDSNGNKLLSLDTSDIGRSFNHIAKPVVKTASQPTLPFWRVDKCDLGFLKRCLQTAIALELSTIPPYMTALYSIKSYGDAYNNVKSVFIQEMLHMALAANLLISIGGKPQIDNPDKSYIPKCFPSRLPGGVLPNLLVTLEKASPQHIRDVFMMIEYPTKLEDTEQDTYISLQTIGAFYSRIQRCMIHLAENGEISFGNQGKQLGLSQWFPSTKVSKIKDINSANAAIDMIIEQGEGSKQQDPRISDTEEFAHFFKFAELACKHHLKINDEQKTYTYTGKEIKFDVWPMRDNPVSGNIPENTKCYDQAKAFQGQYRKLLTLLQKTFDGDDIFAFSNALQVMYKMPKLAKDLMKIPADDGSQGNCGPIFDYEWGECKPDTPLK